MEFPYGRGDILCGRFQVEEALGVPGQMAYAVKVKDLLTTETVVAKILHRTVKENPLLAQYHKLRKIQSRQLARALAYFEHVDGQIRDPILLLEYVEGPTLSAWVADRGVRERLEVVADIAAALAELQEQGLSHDDVHSDNVLLAEGNRVVLIDPEAGAFGSTRSHMRSNSAPLSDREGLLFLIDDLFGADRAPVEPVTVALQNEQHAPTFRAIARQVRGLLADRQLAGEMSGTLADLAQWNSQDVARRRDMYRQTIEARQTAFLNLVGATHPLVETLGLNVDPTAAADWDRARSQELESLTKQRARYQGRNFVCTTDDGDILNITMNSTADFRRPFHDPNRPDLIGTGMANLVTVEGTSFGVEPLEYTWTDGVPSVWSKRHDWRTPFDRTRIERTLRVLCGARHAVFPMPEVLGSQRISPSGFKLEVFVPDPARRQELPGPDSGLAGLRYAIELALRMPRTKLPGLALDLYRLLEGPGGLRLPLMAELRTEFLETFGNYFECIYELDITITDPLRRNLRVELEARPHDASVERWTYSVVVESR